jgi:branched-chain amino acid transport system permease protein
MIDTKSISQNSRSRIIVWVFVLAALVLFPFFVQLVTGQSLDSEKPKFWQGLMVQVFILSVFAVSYDLLMGFTGILSFGHAMFFGGGAYSSAIFLKHVGWSLEAVIPTVIGIAIAQSLLVGVLSVRVRGVYLTMATLAFAQLFLIIATATDFSKVMGAEDGIAGVPVPDWLNSTNERLRFYYIALGFAIVMYLVARRLVGSPVGKVMVAIRENEPRAQMIGYNTFVYKLIAVTVSGVLAALAGMMWAIFNFSATPSVLGAGFTVTALLMTIIGGVGTLIGPVIGAGVYELMNYQLADWFKEGGNANLVLGIVFILIVMFFPFGLVGTWQLRGGKWRNILTARIRSISSWRPGPPSPPEQR